MSPEPLSQVRTAAERRIDIGKWAAFFVWTGVALLAHLNWGSWLLGFAVIVLAAQAARWVLLRQFERSSLVVGTLLLIGGGSRLDPLGVNIALIPLMCIFAGAILLGRALTSRTRVHSW